MKKGTKEVQKLIKDILKEMGWSLSIFADKFLTDQSDYDVDEEQYKSFKEKVKKQLQRESTKLETLELYLSYLLNSDEFKKLIAAGKIKWLETETTVLDEYQKLISIEKDLRKKKVLEVASAHALSVGSAYDFKIVELKSDDEYECRFLVLWEGDIGYNCGSATSWTAMCEVVENHFGIPFVRKANYDFQTGIRFVKDILGYDSDGVLTLQGYSYGPYDPQNHPNVRRIVEMIETGFGWHIKDEYQVISDANTRYFREIVKLYDCWGEYLLDKY